MNLSIACITPYIPYDGIDHAGGEYLRRYVDAVVKMGHAVTLLAPNTESNQKATSANNSVADIELIDLPRSASALTRAWRIIAKGSSEEPGEDWVRRLTPRIVDILKDADLIDLQWTESIARATAIKHLVPETPIVATLHDVMTESIGRACRSPSPRVRIRALAAYRSARRLERNNLNKCDQLFVFKDADRTTLRDIGVTSTTQTTMPVVDPIDSFPSPDPNAMRLLFTGAMFRAENSEAVDWFLGAAWARIREEFPDAKLRIAGSKPPEHLMRIDDPTVEVTGYLRNMEDAYQGVTVVISPLQRGAGLKFKVIQAMAAAYPIVCTTIAAEGVRELVGVPPRHVEDDITGFADAVSAVLRQPHAELEESRRLARVIAPNLDFEARMSEIVVSYVDTVSRGTNNPPQN